MSNVCRHSQGVCFGGSEEDNAPRKCLLSDQAPLRNGVPSTDPLGARWYASVRDTVR